MGTMKVAWAAMKQCSSNVYAKMAISLWEDVTSYIVDIQKMSMWCKNLNKLV